MAMKMTVTNTQGFEFPAGEYILKLTKVDPPEEQEFEDRKSMRSTWYFTVVEVIDTEAEDDDEVMGKELRKYITIPENGMTPRSNLRQYTEALLGRKLEPGVDEWDSYDQLAEDLIGRTMKGIWDTAYVPVAGREVQGIQSVSPHKRRRRRAEADDEPQDEQPRRRRARSEEPEDDGDDEPF